VYEFVLMAPSRISIPAEEQRDCVAKWLTRPGVGQATRRPASRGSAANSERHGAWILPRVAR
jgi:hypothetical protein